MPVNKVCIYKSLVEHLSKKCQELQMYNEQYVQRITKIKKIKRQRRRDVSILKTRLDKFKDNWRAVSMKRQLAPHPKRKTEQKRGPKPKIRPPPTQMVNANDQEKDTRKITEPQQLLHRSPFRQFSQQIQPQRQQVSKIASNFIADPMMKNSGPYNLDSV